MKRGLSHRDKAVKLTPQLFEELDLIARTQGGCVIEVEDHNKMRGMFGAMPYMAGDVYIDLSAGDKCCNAATIILSNQMDIREFQATVRPEMDWAAIPVDRIYHFILFHEIGHTRLDPIVFDMVIKGTDGGVDREGTRKVRLACELRADRYAWNSLFPDKPLPQKGGTESMVRELEAFMKDHERLFLVPRGRKVLPTDPGHYVPVSHVEKGIPWAA